MQLLLQTDEVEGTWCDRRNNTISRGKGTGDGTDWRSVTRCAADGEARPADMMCAGKSIAAIGVGCRIVGTCVPNPQSQKGQNDTGSQAMAKYPSQ